MYYVHTIFYFFAKESFLSLSLGIYLDTNIPKMLKNVF